MGSADSNPDKRQVPSDDAPDSPVLKKLEETIANWAKATEADNVEDAQAASMEGWSLVVEAALRNPSPDVQLMIEADDLESKGRWPEAEAMHRKVLALEESSGNFGMIAKAQMDLCSLLLQVGRIDEAWRLSVAATASARRTEMSLVIVMALLYETSCALAIEDPGKALAAGSEAVQLIEPGKLLDNMRSKALTARAKCLLAIGDPSGAESDLASAWDFLQANPVTIMMPGPNWTLGTWWEAKSRLEQSRGDDFRAREALTLAIEHRRQSPGPHGLLALARALEMLGAISKTAGDLTAEEQALQEAKSIRDFLHLPAGN